jgi:hypothetical protein
MIFTASLTNTTIIKISYKIYKLLIKNKNLLKIFKILYFLFNSLIKINILKLLNKKNIIFILFIFKKKILQLTLLYKQKSFI